MAGLKKIIGLGGYWTLNKTLTKEIGVIETLVLQHLIDLTESAFKRKEIFQPIPNIADELSLSQYAVKQAIGNLKAKDLINVERKSVGYMNWYSINEQNILNIISGSIDSPVSSNTTDQLADQLADPGGADEIDSPVSSNTPHSAYDIGRSITNNTTNNTPNIPRVILEGVLADSLEAVPESPYIKKLKLFQIEQMYPDLTTPQHYEIFNNQ